MQEKPLGADAAVVDEAGAIVPVSQLSHAERIQQAGRDAAPYSRTSYAGLKTPTYIDRVALAGAKEALLIVRALLSRADGYGTESAIAFDRFIESDLDYLLTRVATATEPLSEASGSLRSEAP